MNETIRGRVVRAGGDPAAGARVQLVVPGTTPGEAVRAGADGTFALDGDRAGTDGAAGPVVVRIRDRFGGPQDVVVPDGDVADLVVVVPEPADDPRERVRKIVELVEAEDEAAEEARVALADRTGARVELAERTRRATDRVLTALGRRAGDLRWRYDGSRPMAGLLVGAVEAGRSVLEQRPRTVLADEGVLEDGQQLPSTALTAVLSGQPPRRDGFWRADPLARLRLRQRLQGPDGLPLPAGERRSEADAGDAAVAAEVPASIAAKVSALVEAIRLPEDPPVLGSGSVITAAGAEVELPRGIADVTAFHDVHELVLALPEVWQEVFDQRLVSVVRTAVGHALAAGIDLEPPEGIEDDDPAGEVAVTAAEKTLERLLGGLRRLDLLYDGTSAHRIAPRLSTEVPPATALTRTLSGSNGVVFRQGDRYPNGEQDLPPGGGSGPRGPHLPGAEQVPEDGGQFYRPTPRDLLQELQSFLTGGHSFTVFAADGAQRAINFGVMLDWRQLWEPKSYQTGEIAHTLTLAPGEQRKVVTRRRRTLKRFTAEAEKSSRGRTSESGITSRAEAEIIDKATATTNFQLSSSGSTKLLVSDGSFSTSASRNVVKDGTDMRRRFHEAVVKAAQEYRDEHSVEIRTESEDVTEEESTVELRNPHSEAAMTGVFYSLQRRYHVSERLHRARPVILVAMPVPDPAEITTSWIIRYAWILSRSLLERRFEETIRYLTTSYLGDKEILLDLQRAADQHEDALRQAQHRLGAARLLLEQRGEALRELREALASGDSSRLDEVLQLFGIPGVNLVNDVLNFAGGLFGGGDDEEERKERAAKLLEASEDEFARAEREAREAETQLAAASSAYQEAVRDLVRARAESRNREVQIAELRVHLRDNILAYMQAIWSTQVPDQRFFELHTVQVPVLTDQVRVVRTGVLDSPGVGGFTAEQFRVEFAADGGEIEFRPLVEMCNLDTLLGFLGNFAIFELWEGNALTDLVLAPYLDRHEVLRDPDDIAASWTLDSLQEYADRLRREVAEGRMTQEEFDEQHAPFLRATLERLITESRPTEDDVVVPSNSFYLELLTSGGSLLEPFQREHRAVDVARAREQGRHEIFESLRRASLILAEDLADPDMDKFERQLVSAAVDGVGNGNPPGPPGGPAPA